MSTTTLERSPNLPAAVTTAGRYAIVDSPLGSVFLGVSDAGVRRVDFIRDGREEAFFASMLALDAGDVSERVEASADPLLAETARQLGEYFTGTRQAFDLLLAPRGTDFQRAVWDRLLAIPFGETTTYGAIAAQLGRPSASRAVGASVGRNPIGVVIPCHRVIGSTGALTGYAGGLDRKRQLLDLEAMPLRGDVGRSERDLTVRLGLEVGEAAAFSDWAAESVPLLPGVARSGVGMSSSTLEWRTTFG